MLTGDSQPVELRESAFTVLSAGQERRPCLVSHQGTDFAASVGFVGTEKIGLTDTRAWLQNFCATQTDLNVDAFCEALTTELTSLWNKHGYDTCLWIFIGGVSEGEPIFRAVRNCGPDMDADLLYTRVGADFVHHNDLANHLAAYGQPGETLMELLMRSMAFYRNGVLLPAVGLLDGFYNLTQSLVAGGYPGFAPVSTLESYADIVRMRGEFVKRMFDPSKGIYQSKPKPIGGTIYLYRVELDGSIYDHRSKDKPVQLMGPMT